jgi:hypothetical protein
MDLEQAPPDFLPDPEEPGDGMVSILADEASLGGNRCRWASAPFECRPPDVATRLLGRAASEGLGLFGSAPAEAPEPLGPSFFLPREDAGAARADLGLFRAGAGNPYCTEAVRRRAREAGEEGSCIQRQELRLQDTIRHEAGQSVRYALRLRLPARIEDEVGSLRWVTAQWKEEPLSPAYAQELGQGWGPSPFLAQRFDDGVLHITVQDEHCRCLLASAPEPSGGQARVWADGPARYCVSTRPDAGEGKACTADLEVEYGEDPVLTSPRGRWVELAYLVRAGRGGDAAIEVFEGERFILRVTGRIGYEPAEGVPTFIRFKMGTYRDYLPFPHAMEIDYFRMEPVPDR